MSGWKVKMKPILAIIVLYRMSLRDSPTYRTLHDIFVKDPRAAGLIDLVVADNSPEAQVVSSDFEGRYVHDGENPGLAKRYNDALAFATAEGSRWLLTLDQDTTLTEEYLRELLELADRLADEGRIAVITPKLVAKGRIFSPHAPTFQGARYKVGWDSVGVVGENVRAYNSASLVRVQALHAIGGYPMQYWLDFLDHATFTALQRAGGQVYVMRAILEHDASQANPETTSPARAENILRAEERFYREYGTPKEQFWYKVDLMRQVIGHGRRGRFAEAKRRWGLLVNKG